MSENVAIGQNYGSKLRGSVVLSTVYTCIVYSVNERKHVP